MYSRNDPGFPKKKLSIRDISRSDMRETRGDGKESASRCAGLRVCIRMYVCVYVRMYACEYAHRIHRERGIPFVDDAEYGV